MNKEMITVMISDKMKLIRIEKGYTQDKMADILGVSKKTLVQIEKGRISAGWTVSIAVCSLFRESEILQAALGSDPIEVIETIAHEGITRQKGKTMGGKVWWKELEKKGCFRLQQNVISQHYRILDEENYRWYSSFDEKEAKLYLDDLSRSNEFQPNERNE
jgi:DNA-binding XRE family transcriptional regulator